MRFKYVSMALYWKELENSKNCIEYNCMIPFHFVSDKWFRRCEGQEENEQMGVL